MKEYCLICEDLVTSQMYCELLIEEFKLDKDQDMKPDSYHRFLVIDYEPIPKDYYYLSSAAICGSRKPINNFPEFRKLCNKLKITTYKG